MFNETAGTRIRTRLRRIRAKRRMEPGSTSDALSMLVNRDRRCNRRRHCRRRADSRRRAVVAAAAVIVDFGSSVCERANASEIDLETRPKAASLPDEQTRRIKEYHVLHEGDGAEKSAIPQSLLALICTFDCDLKRNELGAKFLSVVSRLASPKWRQIREPFVRRPFHFEISSKSLRDQ